TASVKAFVYTSSISAEVGWNRQSTLDPPMPLSQVNHYFPYARSKAIIEQYTLDANSPTFATASIRPSAILNSTVMTHFTGSAPPWMTGKPMDWIGAKDLARAHVMLADALADPVKRTKCAGKVYRDALAELIVKRPLSEIPSVALTVIPPLADLVHKWTLGPVPQGVFSLTSNYITFRKKTILLGLPDEGWEEFGYRPESTLRDAVAEYLQASSN
ncbi:hypothetical protein HK405_009877, partial [Cladochytrium tenue]